jgi:hypothetical protein
VANASRYRALASLCRQQAAYNPSNSWQLLGQAERWEHLAEAEIADCFKDCNTTTSRNPAPARATYSANHTRLNGSAAA